MSQFNPKSTLSIQMTSLCNFMSQLSYHFDVGHGYFVSEEKGARAFQKISFAKAVEMHNAWDMGHERKGLMAWSGWLSRKDGFAQTSVLSGFRVPAYNLQLAFAAKLVEQVKLQYARKADFPIQVQSDMVKFAHPAFAGLFGFNEEE